jgi:hypothetical protein
MLKVRDPFWSWASLVCEEVPEPEGSRTYAFPTNDIHRAYRIGCIDYLAYGSIFMPAMFCSKMKLDVFLARKAIDACWPGGRR